MIKLNRCVMNIRCCLFAAVFPFSLSANAGLLDSCFGKRSYKPMTEKELLTRAKGIEDKFDACYVASICISAAEKALTKKQSVKLKESVGLKVIGGTPFRDEYLNYMGISEGVKYMEGIKDDAVDGYYGLGDIYQSGFLNFKRKSEYDNRFFHTVYIQVTSDRRMFVFNSNSLPLARHFIEHGYEEIFSAQRFELSGKLELLNDYIREEHAEVYFSPVDNVVKRLGV